MKYVKSRFDLFADIPPGSTGAVIGVQTGAFEAVLDDFIKPKKMHLVDCWQHQETGPYSLDPANVSQEEQDHIYAKVVELAKIHPSFEIHRSFSKDVYRKLGELDWVYIDADHSASGVYNDLDGFQYAIRQGGFIMGHDFIENGKSRQMGFGVVHAVGDFCQFNDWTIDALTLEEWSSYRLIRR